MINMKRTKAERTAASQPSTSAGDDYPYGLRVQLDHESLKKLGVNSLPKVGSTLHVHAHAHVVSAEEHSEGGKKHRRVSLELRKMKIGDGEDAAAPTDQEQMSGAKAEMDKALGKPGQ